MPGKIIISDYDDTIVDYSGDYFDIVFTAVIGEDEYEKMKELTKKGINCDFVNAYIKENNYNKECIKKLWENFKKTSVYDELISANSERINRILDKDNKIPENNATEYYMNELLIPIVAVYDVLIKQCKPNEAFFELYRQSKENGDIFLINTFKSQKLIEAELKEYINLNKEKYRAFEELINKKLVLGTTDKSCKADDDRIKTLLSNLNLSKDNTLIVMGDSYTDLKNFEEAYNLNNNSQFLFVRTRLDRQIKDFNEQINFLKEKAENFKRTKNKLNKAVKELNDVEKKKEQFKANNFKSGEYNELAKSIYIY